MRHPQALLTKAEVQAWLRVSPNTVSRMVARGDLVAVRVNHRGDLRFHVQDVQDFIERRRTRR